jgi:hypothetical protein
MKTAVSIPDEVFAQAEKWHVTRACLAASFSALHYASTWHDTPPRM